MKDTNLQQGLVRKRPMAKIISVSPRTVDNLRNARIIPFLKVRGLILFDPEAVIAALKAYERKTAK
jgi:hypothetical protein